MDLVILLLLFINGHFELPFPLPGKKLNNPLALLLILFFLRGVLNTPFRDRQLEKLEKLLTSQPDRTYFFVLLFTIEIGLQIMWFAYPLEFLWNLNAEQGYGTQFSVIQLYILGLVVMMTAWADCGSNADWKDKLPWYLVASVYFFIGLDDCIAIHENLIFWSQNIIPDSTTFHFIHEWLWFYGPVALVVVVFLSRFFLKKFLYSPAIIVTMFVALMFWISVLLLEGLAKNIVDPLGVDYGRILIGIEEGSEMIGATLFMLGFSKHLKNILEGKKAITKSS
ncbi:MAG: hypothetical protein F3740_09090 [Nitrospinae bacterium]|nr:hypothetical protein [Nitrospinota bacterium]